MIRTKQNQTRKLNQSSEDPIIKTTHKFKKNDAIDYFICEKKHSGETNNDPTSYRYILYYNFYYRTRQHTSMSIVHAVLLQSIYS